MPMQLDGRRVVVSGGLGALGQALSRLLIERGARVAVIDRAIDRAAPGMAQPGPVIVLGGVDLADEIAATRAFDAAALALGGIDGLAHVAGGFAWQTLDSGAASTFDRMYAANLRSSVVAAQAALPHLLRAAPAAIVHVGAMAGLHAGQGMAAYAASKAGVARLAEAMAEEFKLRGLRVNAVLPSTLDTPANRADMPDADPTRWVSLAELAQVVAFLLSHEASAITGASVPVVGRV